MTPKTQASVRNQKFTGIWTALASPFKLEGNRRIIDIDAYKRLIQLQVEAGVSGVIPCGTTGESPTLSLNEKKLLIQTALEMLKDEKVKVIAGTGSNNTQATIEFSQWASDAGVEGLLLVCPYYNKPTQKGMIAHFEAVAEAVNCEIMLYNVPGRTNVSLTPESIARLATNEKITALKEATGDMNFLKQIQEALSSTGLTLNLLSGDDPTFLEFLKNGGHGAVSVASNLIPKAMNEMYHAFLAGENEQALGIHEKYASLFRLLFIEPNPVPLKQALHHVGLCSESVRLPLVEMESANKEKLKAELIRLGLKPQVPLTVNPGANA